MPDASEEMLVHWVETEHWRQPVCRNDIFAGVVSGVPLRVEWLTCLFCIRRRMFRR
jgi:hypothetical protein